MCCLLGMSADGTQGEGMRRRNGFCVSNGCQCGSQTIQCTCYYAKELLLSEWNFWQILGHYETWDSHSSVSEEWSLLGLVNSYWVSKNFIAFILRVKHNQVSSFWTTWPWRYGQYNHSKRPWTVHQSTQRNVKKGENLFVESKEYNASAV
jgi:hypothetical protein